MVTVRKINRTGGGPLVSVITVVLNGEQTIERTIRSVLDQSYTHLEYIVVDGGSTDKTLEIIRKFERTNRGRLRFISEPDEGISDAWNKGIRMASGELIGLINADDWYEKDAIAKIVSCKTDNHTIVCGNVKLWNSSYRYNVKRSSLTRIESKMTIWHPGMFCPREVYKQVGLYDSHLKILMDYDFVVRCYLRDVSFRFIDEEIANMKFGGVSNRLISKSMSEALSVKNKYFGVKIRHFCEYAFYQAYFHAVIILKKVIYERVSAC
ncbi:MAG: glycosyltransferase family 2 protein [Prolixibacteraceae bacterium]